MSIRKNRERWRSNTERARFTRRKKKGERRSILIVWQRSSKNHDLHTMGTCGADVPHWGPPFSFPPDVRWHDSDSCREGRAHGLECGHADPYNPRSSNFFLFSFFSTFSEEEEEGEELAHVIFPFGAAIVNESFYFKLCRQTTRRNRRNRQRLRESSLFSGSTFFPEISLCRKFIPSSIHQAAREPKGALVPVYCSKAPVYCSKSRKGR